MRDEIVVEAASDGDLPALASMDLHYPAHRVLRLDREQHGAEHAFTFRWHEGSWQRALYNTYDVGRLRAAMGRADAFFVATTGERAVGLLMVVVPSWTDAGEITDLAVDASQRRIGAGRALVSRAIEFARDRGLRALWVEPRSDNADAIAFYLALGFRLSGFNDRMYSNADDAAGRTTLYLYREL